ncbi:Endoribonuclease YbeY [Fundidesulfovibrio magnetotacticus]|uniref:Endoribonuclease YbeY n=1 Tax=Fundidesulfovibrio magnetotacticus TaxID=2730080 RepID=A0A6V8LZP1_9BACT|nr:rRNA maturation RNase YbeY [Fundidesulfovibrio magnetotacticus]GFK95107.1 Endoribonuclease YbeY [Fundidesulfovibrio magnetotacticus]
MRSTIWVEQGAFLDPTLPLSRSELTPLMERLMEALGLSGASVELRCVDDAEMARLNGEFLGLPGPTNILSFPAEDAERPDYLGELALGVDTLSREAALYGQEPREHLARLLAHGLLHLAGHEHGQVMDELTDLGVAALR